MPLTTPIMKPLAEALARQGYDTLTPVQTEMTRPDLIGADLLVSAQTGSGKTVGFGLAIAPTLLDEAGALPPAAAPLALIIAPTRELALQVRREFQWLYADCGAVIASCVGGMDMRDERRALDRGAHVVVATPGRLVDHIKRGSLDMSAIRAVVLDEADEMLDLGFREDLEFILAAAPTTRRTLMFSATVPPGIVALSRTYLSLEAVRVTTTGGASQHADIAYEALRVSHDGTEGAIINLLRHSDARNAIVFCNTRATVNRLTARFHNRGFAVVALSGELTQTERSHALQSMRDGRARVCVATDVAARGIDLPGLELVIHADLPTNADTLLHRSGRTGRAGNKGLSALIVPPRARGKAERLLRTARITAEWGLPPSAEDVRARDEERLLSDPLWSAPVTPEEADMVARITASHSPEQVAAACLRLFTAQHSAPEDLPTPEDRPQKREDTRAAFGPSAWVKLSVGARDRAEARWLLPMLCRAGGLSKTDIGAIRVGDAATHVELSAPRLPAFLSAIGPDRVLEDGVTAAVADAPTESGQAPRPKPRAAKKPHRGQDSSPAPQADDAPRKPRAKSAAPHAAPAKPKAPKPAKPEPRDEAVHATHKKPPPRAHKGAPGKPGKPAAPSGDKTAADTAKPAPKYRKGAADASARLGARGKSAKGGKPGTRAPRGPDAVPKRRK